MTTLVKLNNNVPVFNSFFDDFFRRDLHAGYSQNKVAVNIKENKEGYHVALVAPGFKKDQIAVTIEEKYLKINGNVANETEENTEERYTIKEFQKTSFEKKYKLPNEVDVENINAKYEDGILNIWIPRKANEETKAVKNIQIG